MKNTETLTSSTFRYKPLDGYMSEYFQKTHISYNYSLAGNSITSHLYKLDLEQSSVSEGAGTKMETIGPESPYVFSKIENVPIFNVTTVDVPTGWSDENGYTSELRMECIVQPSNLAIDVDDYLVLDYSTYQNLWRVVEAIPSTFEEVYYTKLTLMPTPYSKENIEFQVRKRYNYIFESGFILDSLTNNTINDLLLKLNNYYQSFMSEYYAKQGIFIRKDLLESLPSKFFSFSDLPDDVIVYNYFFKKYITPSFITIYIDHKENIDTFMKYKNIAEAFGSLFDDEVKFVYILCKELEKAKKFSEAMDNSLKFIANFRKNKIDNDIIDLFNKFETPYENFFDMSLDFYKLISSTSKLIEEAEVVVSEYNNTNYIKIFSNLKKMIKELVTNSESKDIFLKSLLVFIMFKSLTLKNITFTLKSIEYGV